MVFFGSSFADSPVLAIAPQTAHQAITLGKATFPCTTAPMNRRTFAPSQMATSVPTRSTGASRKRSREEAEPDLSDTDETTPLDSAAPSPVNMSMSGNDMVLPDREVASSIQPATHSGAEAMRRSEIKTSLQMQHDQQLSGRSHKTQRRNQNAAAAAHTGVTESTTFDLKSKHSEGAHLVVDDFTLRLGIGWRRISNDEHIQAAARGWARFIENHYPISNVVIGLESKGLESYLVQASEGYFLFDENLRHGRLVSTTSEGALQNLHASPPAFEGPYTMMAAAQAKMAPYGQAANTRVFGTHEMEMEVC